MAVAEVKRLELLVHRSAIEAVMSRLQDWGQCEISKPERDDPSMAEQLAEASSGYESTLTDLNYALRFLKPYYDDPVSGLSRMLGDRETFQLEGLEALAKETSEEELVAQVRAFERKSAELKAKESADKTLLEMLYGLSDLQVPLSLVHQGTDKVGAFLGTGTPESLRDWKISLERELGEDCDVQLGLPVGKSQQVPWGLVLFMRGSDDQVTALTAKHGITRFEVPETVTGTAKEEREKLEAEIKSYQQEGKDLEEQIKAFAAAHVPVMQKLHDYYQSMADRQEAQNRGTRTDQVVHLKGWVRAKLVEDMKKLLAPYEGSIDLTFRDPIEGENPPIALENPSFVKPLETLTMLYGAPQYGAADPSFFMFPFFLLFFGLCYADAGYGIIVTLLTGWVLLKYKKMPDGPKQFIKLVFYSGIATAIVGAAVGGWFGNTVETYPFLAGAKPFVEKLQLINPMNNPLLMLGFSLLLGVIHIYCGLLIAFFTNLRRREYLVAFADQGGWMIFLGGLLAFGVGAGLGKPEIKEIGKWAAIAGAVILVLTQGRAKKNIIGKAVGGVMSLYQVTAYLGDLLSYSRLLALGLVGGVVAMIVNLMSHMMSSTPYVGWLIALAIFLLGHVFSMVINILGAFVHPLRLQYVEFFGKFFESGGKELKPLRHRPDYVNIGNTTR